MSDPDQPLPRQPGAEPGDTEVAPESLPEDAPEDPQMSALLKRSLTAGDAPVPSILRGVQKRIRKRSRGRFFGDGWSTTDARVSHALVALAMLLVLVAAYFALGPVGIQ